MDALIFLYQGIPIPNSMTYFSQSACTDAQSAELRVSAPFLDFLQMAFSPLLLVFIRI